MISAALRPAKADLVLVGFRVPQMVPTPGPVRSLVYHAADRTVHDVFVDGRRVVPNRKVLTLDHADAGRRLALAQHRMLNAAPNPDYRRRDGAEFSPLNLPLAN